MIETSNNRKYFYNMRDIFYLYKIENAKSQN